MSWAAVFWIVYGVSSTLFVIYLFHLGKTVASNRKQLIQQEIERLRHAGADETPGAMQQAWPAASAPKLPEHTSRMHVERIFQPDEKHIAVQGVRDGERCLINLPVDSTGDTPPASAQRFSQVQRVV